MYHHRADMEIPRRPDAAHATEEREGAMAAVARLALRRRLVTMRQAAEILARQLDDPRSFGDLAVALGYLTADQLDELLVMA